VLAAARRAGVTMSERQRYFPEQITQKSHVMDQVLTAGEAIRPVARELGVAERGASLTPSYTAHKCDISKRTSSSSDPGPSSTFPVSSEESRELFSLFVNAIGADVAVTRVSPPADLPAVAPKLIPALAYLAEQGGQSITVGQLAEGIGVSFGWGSRVADELVSFGIVERIRHDHDRRIVRLQLTPRATVICRRLWSNREGAIVAALGGIAPDDRPVIARFLRRFITELKSQTSKAAPDHL
jgi:DNA-binding MarR family transcriptional regulator